MAVKCAHAIIHYGIWRSECQACGMAWVGVDNPAPDNMRDVAYSAYRAWQEYGELTESALEDMAKQYGMQEGEWPAIRQCIQRYREREVTL